MRGSRSKPSHISDIDLRFTWLSALLQLSKRKIFSSGQALQGRLTASVYAARHVVHLTNQLGSDEKFNSMLIRS